jgi:hypothetical protein
VRLPNGGLFQLSAKVIDPMEYQNNVLPYIHAEEDATKEADKVVEKVELTDDEKKKFNLVFRDRYAEVHEKARKDTAKALEEQAQKLKADFDTKIAELSAKKIEKPAGEVVDETAEAKRIVADYKRTIEEREKELKANQITLKEKDTKIQTMIKDRAITDALSGIPFVNLKQVKVLTGDAIELDADSGNYVVRNEEGQIMMGDDFKPVSLKDYFTKYAELNPHMVRSDVKGGAGSTPNAAPGTPGEFANIKSKADLASDMKLRIRYVEKYGLEKYTALPK